MRKQALYNSFFGSFFLMPFLLIEALDAIVVHMIEDVVVPQELKLTAIRERLCLISGLICDPDYPVMGKKKATRFSASCLQRYYDNKSRLSIRSYSRGCHWRR